MPAQHQSTQLFSSTGIPDCERPIFDGEPLVVERHGRRLAVVGLTDLDGTANNELVPEHQRAATVRPGCEAVQLLSQHGIPTGIISGRSVGEALLYKRLLDCRGPVVCEDGAVMVLPAGVAAHLPEQIDGVAGRDRLTDGSVVLILSDVSLAEIQGLVTRVQSKLQVNGSTGMRLITSYCPPEEVVAAMPAFGTAEAAEAAGKRLASAFIVPPAHHRDTFMQALRSEVEGSRVRTFSEELPHLIPLDADKGKALRVFCQIGHLLFPQELGIQGILPVGFGNNINDIKLFQKLGPDGLGVLVGHPESTRERPRFFVQESTVAGLPETVIRSWEPYGYGMLAGAKQVIERLKPGTHIERTIPAHGSRFSFSGLEP